MDLYKKFDKAGITIKDKSIVVNATEWKKKLYYEDVVVMKLSTGEYRVTGKRVESDYFVNGFSSFGSIQPDKDDWERMDPKDIKIGHVKEYPWSKPKEYKYAEGWVTFTDRKPMMFTGNNIVIIENDK